MIPATLYRGGTGRNTDLSEALVRDHTLSGELKHPKKSTCLTIHLHGLEWVVFTFGNISQWFIP